MAGLTLANGDCLSISGHRYTCAGKGPGGRYLLVPHKGRSQKYLAAEELLDLSESGKIELHDASDYYREFPRTQVNLSSISKDQHQEIMMRCFYMNEMDEYRCQGGKLSEKPIASLVLRVHKKYVNQCKELGQTPPEYPMSESACRRWYRKWQKSGGNVLSQIRNPSGNRHSKLSIEQREIIAVVIDELFLTNDRRPVTAVHELMSAKIDLENRSRLRDGLKPIKTPSYNTLCRHIRKLDLYEVLKNRYNNEYAYKMTRHQRCSPMVHKHLEQVQADHTQADIYVDLGVGVLVRPWITLLIDSYSKSILGFWISPDSPSAQTVMDALRMAIMPKNIIELGGEPEWQWPMFGLPEELILDNGKDFLSLDLEQAALELGISLTYSPPRQAFYKAQIERHFGAINKRLLAKLPGQVFKYEPEKHGLDYPHLTFDEFSKIFIQWVTTLAHRTPTKSGDTPMQLWQNSIQKNGFSGTGLEEDFVKLCLSKSSHKRFAIQPDGIHFNSLVYNNEWLSRYRNQIASASSGRSPTVEFKWSAANVGLIWVFDEKNHSFFPVQAKDEMAHERSLFNHKVVLRERRNRKKANLSDSSYHDAVLALDKTVNDFADNKGLNKLPAKASRYIRGAPSSVLANNIDTNPAQPLNMPKKQVNSDPPTQDVSNFDDDLDDAIDDIADDIEL